ncbi:MULTISPECIES: PepSY-like domain-containing protein [unclassified Sphingobacterium]|uniref:PepSY-like domain-containing protein n=1 Tax=unclassified Sphingobacterium TaxID=2609468 RepID=UPI00265D517B|nr:MULTISPECIES: PepSY-like domain-containing protein [unclassified Sphingobacterium]WKK59845.1 PepSY-like domain-containing protein [Sphingobacterium sp. BN32]
MKKLLLSISLVLSIAVLTMSCDKETVVTEKDLPTTASQFINSNFNGVKILSVVEEKEGLSGKEYEVLLDNGIEIKFDKNGNWLDIDAVNDSSVLPDNLIPAAILTYVKTNYPNSGINSIEKENYGYDVELTNGLDLVFDKDGKFVRIDP